MKFTCVSSPVTDAEINSSNFVGRRAKVLLKGIVLRYYLNHTPFDNVELQLLKAFFDSHSQSNVMPIATFIKIFDMGELLCRVLYRKFQNKCGLHSPEQEPVHIVNPKLEVLAGFPFAQFLEAAICLGPRATEDQKLMFAFKLFDLDGDGFISKSEYEELLLESFSKSGIAMDRTVAKNHIANQWEAITKGLEIDELSFQAFRQAVNMNPALLQAISIKRDWMDKILQGSASRPDQQMGGYDVGGADCLHAFLNAIFNIEVAEIDRYREIFRDHLCNTVGDLKTLTYHHFRSMELPSNVSVLLKKHLKSHPLSTSTKSMDLYKHNSIEEMAKKVNIVILCGFIIFICIGLSLFNFNQQRNYNNLDIYIYIFIKCSSFAIYFLFILTLFIIL